MEKQKSGYQKSIFIFSTGIIFVLIGYFVGNKLAHFSFLEKKTTISNDIILVKKIAETSVLEVHDIAVQDFDNSSKINKDDNFIATWWKSTNNTLNRKHLKISIPMVAKFGIALQDSNFTIHQQSDSIFISLPSAKLLSFELNLSEKQILSEKGWLVWSDNETFIPLEKYLYDREKLKYETDEKLIKQALEIFKEKITLIYKGLGKKVIWIAN